MKNSFPTKIALILFLTISNFVFSQVNENTKVPNVIPSNPKAFEFMKYGEIPVSKYTGVPNISIPIYTIKVKGLNIPINLSYHSNGFRVNEEAGWTGLGWTLHVGGSINQIVKGTDDFGYYKNRTLPDFLTIGAPYLPQSAIGTCSQFFIAGSLNPIISSPLGCNYLEPIYEPYVNGEWDSEPDIFSFSFLGYSGKFILDWENEEFVCLSDSKISIEPVNYSSTSPPSDFFIIVPEGHKFLFSLKEEGEYIRYYTTSENGNGGGLELVSRPGERAFRTYILSYIITNKGDMVNYNYSLTNDIIGYPSISNQTTRYEGASLSNSLPNNQPEIDATTSVMVTKQKNAYLNSIEFNNGLIEFITSDRIDIVGGKKLDQIKVKKNISSIPIKTFNFIYNYFNGHNSGNNLDDYLTENSITKTNEELTKRLKLESIQEIGKPSYTFDYNEELALPKKTSLATDYWGYYNGRTANESTYPNLYRFNIQGVASQLLDRFKYNNKGSSLNYTKAAVLNKITYPAGGYSTFEYELNSFDNYLSPDINHGNSGTVNIDTNDGTSNIPGNEIVILQSNTSFTGSALLSVTGCDFNEMYDDTYIKITSFNQELLPIIENTQYSPMYELAALGLIEGSSNFNQANYDYYVNDQELIQMQYNSPEELIINNLNFNFNKGVVYFRAYGGCGAYDPPNNTSGASLTLNYVDFGGHNTISYGAGLRINTISSYSNATKLSSLKTFSYEEGKLMTPLVYVKRSQYNVEDKLITNDGYCQDNNFWGTKLSISSSNIASLSTSASGSYVGYSKVIEMNVDPEVDDNNDNGKIVTFYTNAPDISGIPEGDVITSNPVTLPPTMSNKDNGLVEKEQFFNSENYLLKEVINNYHPIINNNCFYGARYSLSRIEILGGQFGACANAKCHIYQIGAYSIKQREKSQLISSSEFNYFNDDIVVNNNEYTYDNLNQLNYIKETNSNGDIIETEIKYPYDFTTYPNSLMTDNNFLTPIIEKEIKIDGQTAQKEKFRYSPKVILPNSYLTFPIDTYSFAKGANDLEEKKDYDYNSSGNLIYEQTNETENVTYIWGYNGQYPIAKIENFTSSESSTISSLITTAKSASNTDANSVNGNQVAENALRLALNNIRNHSALQDAMMTSYTYDPLIGVTSITDPRGNVVYYEYDEFNRLKHVKDKDGNILSKNEYNYKPQN